MNINIQKIMNINKYHNFYPWYLCSTPPTHVPLLSLHTSPPPTHLALLSYTPLLSYHHTYLSSSHYTLIQLLHMHLSSPTHLSSPYTPLLPTHTSPPLQTSPSLSSPRHLSSPLASNANASLGGMYL